MMLVIIIVFSILTAFLALLCSFIACYGIRKPEKPVSFSYVCARLQKSAAAKERGCNGARLRKSSATKERS